jgi:hypothetical protein
MGVRKPPEFALGDGLLKQAQPTECPISVKNIYVHFTRLEALRISSSTDLPRSPSEIPCGADPSHHIAAVQRRTDERFDEIFVRQIGQGMDGFFETHRTQVMPSLVWFMEIIRKVIFNIVR